MAIPWDLSVECLDTSGHKTKVVEPNWLKHLCSLNINEEPPYEVQCGIMCNVGAYNQEAIQIQRLVAAGMTIACLDLRDQERELWNLLVQNLRKAVHNYSAKNCFLYPLAVVVCARGTEMMTGVLKGGAKATVELATGNRIKLTSAPTWRTCGTSECLYITWHHLTDVNEGDEIYIDTISPGRVHVEVMTVGNDFVDCQIVKGGIIGSKMTVRISQTPPTITLRKKGDRGEYITDECVGDEEEELVENTESILKWAIASDIDGVIIPRAENAGDVEHIADLLGPQGKHLLLISSIDTLLAIENIDEIIAKSDVIYLDRSILVTDLPIEKMFIATKMIAAKCALAGKPFVCISRISEHLPIISTGDIANLVLDHVDAIHVQINWTEEEGLKNAERCVAAAAEVARQAENIQWHPMVYGNIDLMHTQDDPTKVTCISAVELAARSQASVIINLTNSGRSAKLLAHGKPTCPVVVLTRQGHVSRQLRFWRGLRTLHFIEPPERVWACELNARIEAALQYCRLRGVVRAGDPYVTITPGGRDTGFCNTVALHFVGPSNKMPSD